MVSPLIIEKETPAVMDEGPQDRSFHMTPEEFRQHGYQAVDWVADYMARVESFPVLSRVEPGSIRAALSSDPPKHGEPFEAVLADIENIILPGITHWQSPNFYAFFPANGSGPGVLGDLLSSGLGVQGMMWATSPACTELETHVLDWMAGMLDLPDHFLSTGPGGGVIQDSASSATLCALLAARERATRGESNRGGCDGRLVAYASTQAHSSVEKAVRIAGLGSENLRLVEVDDRYAMRTDLLEAQIVRDRAAGLTPCFVVGTAGTTSSLAIDPLPEIGRVCLEHGLWMHVDGAMAGTAALCPEFRFIHDGLEHADSYCFNPHKWMFTNFDCDCFYVRDRGALIGALSILPEYLRNQASESGAVIDYRDWQVPLGRRFRSLKLWFVIRHYGTEGLRHHVRKHVALAQEFAAWVREDPRFELAAPALLNLACFRVKLPDEAASASVASEGGATAVGLAADTDKSDALNQAIMERLNQSGDLFLSHTRLNGKLTLRLCVGQTWTERRHVEKAWRLIGEAADHLTA